MSGLQSFERALIDAFEGRSEWPTLEAYWSNPDPFRAERNEQLAIHRAAFANHDARVRAQMLGDDQ